MWRVNPSSLRGTLALPPSKSQSIRALIFGLMACGTSQIKNLLPSPDVEATIIACQQLGAHIERTGSQLAIRGVDGELPSKNLLIDAGNSGLILRFIGALAGLSKGEIAITGDHSLCQRPVGPLLEGLTQLGATVASRPDRPAIIRGPIAGGSLTIDGADSQPVSGLMIACSFAPAATELHITNPGEKPWVDLTLHWLERLNIPYQRRDHTWYRLEGSSSYDAFNYTVPGDLSTLAFPVAAALITDSPLTITGADLSDPQGDKRLLDILKQMGAQIELGEAIFIPSGNRFEGIEVDVNDCIDAVPILAVIAAYAKGSTTITGAAIARTKECDRLSSITQELRKMGGQIEEFSDGLKITPTPLKGASVDSHGDHRMAMALAVAAMGAFGTTEIHNTACVAKTYPHFTTAFAACGAAIASVRG